MLLLLFWRRHGGNGSFDGHYFPYLPDASAALELVEAEQHDLVAEAVEMPWRTSSKGKPVFWAPYARWLTHALLCHGFEGVKSSRVHPVVLALPACVLAAAGSGFIEHELTIEDDVYDRSYSPSQSVAAPAVLVR